MPKLGEIQKWGNQERIYTLRGWVIVDDSIGRRPMPKLGEIQQWGNQQRIYTLRGWVIADNSQELQEEIDNMDL